MGRRSSCTGPANSGKYDRSRRGRRRTTAAAAIARALSPDAAAAGRAPLAPAACVAPNLYAPHGSGGCRGGYHGTFRVSVRVSYGDARIGRRCACDLGHTLYLYVYLRHLGTATDAAAPLISAARSRWKQPV